MLFFLEALLSSVNKLSNFSQSVVLSYFVLLPLRSPLLFAKFLGGHCEKRTRKKKSLPTNPCVWRCLKVCKKSLEEQRNIPSEERRIRCFDRWSKLDAKRNLLPSYRIVPSLPALFMSGEGTYIWNLRHHMSFYELLMIRVFIF